MAETREPKRIQRRRVRGWRKPDNCVIVDRTSRYGNMFAVRPCDSGCCWRIEDPAGGRGTLRSTQLLLF